jgi:biopolymer transport protein ExbD
MSIQFHCPQCQKKLKAHERQAGAQVQCSGCGQVVVVPTPPPVPDAAAAAPVAEAEVEAPLTFVKKPAADDEMDMTPMIDMTFLLLIFFMVTASFTLQKSIQMPAPDAESAAAQSRTIEEVEQDDDFVIVRIDKDDTVWVNDSEAPSRHELLAKLRDIRESGEQGPGSLLVMASGDCHHETVVMVLDAGTAVGMESVRLANLGEDDF